MKIKRFNLKIGASILLVIILAGLFAPWISPEPPGQMNLSHHFERPSWAHPFGLDQNGADLLTQIAYGARVSLSISIAVVATSVAIGFLLGSIAGIRAGFTDLAISRFIDMLQAFPGFLLTLAFVALMGPSLKNLWLALSVTGWTSFARVVRGEVLHLKNKEYVSAAIACGARESRILFKHIWPNLAGLIAIQASFALASVVLTESGLSFLGLGVPSEIPTWGAALDNGRRYLFEAPHLGLFPGLAILLLTLSFQLLGEGFREHFDPRS